MPVELGGLSQEIKIFFFFFFFHLGYFSLFFLFNESFFNTVLYLVFVRCTNQSSWAALVLLHYFQQKRCFQIFLNYFKLLCMIQYFHQYNITVGTVSYVKLERKNG